MKYFGRYLRYDWPVHFLLLLVNWLPDNVVCLRLRGWLIKPFIGSCGSQLLVARKVTFHNPTNLHLGNDVFIAYGCMLMATDQIVIGDEVMFGPYCVVVSGNHTRQDGSTFPVEVKREVRYPLPFRYTGRVSRSSESLFLRMRTLCVSGKRPVKRVATLERVNEALA